MAMGELIAGAAFQQQARMGIQRHQNEKITSNSTQFA